MTTYKKDGNTFVGDNVLAINEEDAQYKLNNSGRSHMKVYGQLIKSIDGDTGKETIYNLEELN